MAVRKKNTKEVPASGGRALKGVLAVAAVGILAGAIYLVINPTEPKAPVHVASVREERQAILDEKIPKSGPASQPLAHGNVAPPKIPAPVSIAPSSGGDKPVAAPVSIADSTLKIGDPSKADPTELALHPSHFADPTKMANKIGVVSIPLEDEPAKPAPQASGLKTQDPYAEALRLEKARAFTMSMCQGLDGRIWIGSENTQPGDGTGGVQVWDPSKPPLEAFTQFLSPESAAKLKNPNIHGGLGDDNGYAIACDLQGRIWVGHLNHGVSVYNGEKWQNYEVVAGLSIPGSLNGPLGERIFHITVCPRIAGVSPAIFKDTLTGQESEMSGSVWMCTSAGLSIYFPSTDTWSYLTRADGLPSDQANSLAFGAGGTVYVALQCDGIAIASAKDQYKTWKNVRGPDALPSTPTGDGLPTNLMNDIMAAKDGTIYATTTAGLVWSTNGGEAWRYRRGSDYEEKVHLRNGDPRRLEHAAGALLGEDYTTALAEIASAKIVVGHRTHPADVFSPGSLLASPSTGSSHVMSLIQFFGATCEGAYGDGLHVAGPANPAAVSNSLALPALPAAAEVPTAKNIEVLNGRVEALITEPIKSPLPVASLLPDWRTQGAWLGRKGRFWMSHAAAVSPFDLNWGIGADKIQYNVQQGRPGTVVGDSLRYWVSANYSSDNRALELSAPYLQSRVEKGLTTWQIDRRQSEWDDHGEATAATRDGPGLYFSIRIPDGRYCLSLYSVYGNGRKNKEPDRDFVLSVREHPNSQQLDDLTGIESWPELARTRIVTYYGGVYSRFLVNGPRRITVQVDRNWSLNTNLNGAFLDEMDPFPNAYYGNLANEWRPNIRGLLGNILNNVDRLELHDPLAGASVCTFVYALVMRSCEPPKILESTPDGDGARIPLRLACSYYLNAFGRFEDLQHSVGASTARDIEKSLRYVNGLAAVSSQLDGNLVHAHLLRQQMNGVGHHFPETEGKLP